MIPVVPEAPYYAWPIIGQADADIADVRYVDGVPSLRFSVSLFFPEGGGQGGDAGHILVDGHTWQIAHVSAEADGVWCRIQDIHALSSLELRAMTEFFVPGKKVTLVLDRDVRVHNSVCHTAQHLLSAILIRLFNAPTISMRLGASENTIDVDIPVFDAAQARQAERVAADIIKNDLPVSIHLCPPEDAASFNLRKKIPDTDEIVRIVDIGGIDYSPCCGTHVPSTGMIRLIRIIGWEKYKGLTRISFAAGHEAWEFDSSVRDILVECASSAETNPADLPEKIKFYKERNDKLADELRMTQNMWIEAEGARLSAEFTQAILIQAKYNGLQSELLRRAQMDWCGRTAKPVLISDMSALKLFCMVPREEARQVNLKTLLADSFAECGAKSGGGLSVMQGAFDSPESLERCFLICAEKLSEAYML